MPYKYVTKKVRVKVKAKAKAKKPKAKAKKRATGTGSGLKKYRSFVNKKTAGPTKKIKELESKLAAERKRKAKLTKDAQKAYKKLKC